MLGIGIAYALDSSLFLVFVVPGVLGFVLLLLFPLIEWEGSPRDLVRTGGVTAKELFAGYGFDPRKYPDFAWNWLGRFLFFMGLYFNTTFGTFFYAQRLDCRSKRSRESSPRSVCSVSPRRPSALSSVVSCRTSWAAAGCSP